MPHVGKSKPNSAKKTLPPVRIEHLMIHSDVFPPELPCQAVIEAYLTSFLLVPQWPFGLSIGGSGGGHRDACLPPPGRPNSFDLMQFSGKLDKITCWPPPPRRVGTHFREILDPTLLS